jgi:hypothetical protein
MSGIINPYRFGSQTPQLLNEQFEQGATGWVSQTTGAYQAWQDQYTPAILGDFSCEIANTGFRVNAYKNFTPTGSCFMRFRFIRRTVPTGNGVLCTFRDASGNILATLGLAAGSSVFRASIGANTPTNASTAPLIGTVYYGWFEYEKAISGNNAIARAGWSTAGTRRSWPLSGAAGALVVQQAAGVTADAARVMFGSVDAVPAYNFIIDDIQIQSTRFA